MEAEIGDKEASTIGYLTEEQTETTLEGQENPLNWSPTSKCTLHPLTLIVVHH